MGFTSFIGRLFFASVFLFAAWQEFQELGPDGRTTASTLGSKIGSVTDRLSTFLGVQLSRIEIKHVVAADIVLKGIGGVLFILGSSLGAYLLLLHLAIFVPIICDFYNYALEEPEFSQLLTKFVQGVALFGSLVFFLGMRNSHPRRQPSKRVPKTKTS